MILAPAEGRSLAQQMALVPTVARLAAAVAATGVVTVEALWRGSPDGPPCETMEVDGVRHLAVADGSRAGWRVARQVRHLRPDVVHLNGFLQPLPALLTVVAARLGRWGNVRVLLQHHGEQPGRGRTGLAQQALGRFLTAALFTGSDGPDSAAAAFRKAGVVHRGVAIHEVVESSTTLRPRPQADARAATGMTGDPAVLWVGRLIDGKDPETAVASFRGLLASRPTARLWLLTTDRSGESVLARHVARDPLLKAAVTLLGPIPAANMADWYSGCDVYLSTSRREGSGYALVEALACGATPVVSDLAPFRALAGPLGSRFQVGDVEGCTAALLSTLPLPRQQVLDHFAAHLSWSTVARQFLAACGVPPPSTSTSTSP